MSRESFMKLLFSTQCLEHVLVCSLYKYFTILDIDECADEAQNDCDPNALCSNTVGSYFCRCLSGYEGDGRECSGKYWFCFFYLFYIQTQI